MSSNSRDTSYSQFQAILDAALKDYSEKTGKDVLTDPLTKKLESCKYPDDVLGILQEQAQTFNEFRNGCGRMQLMRRLKPTIDVLFALSNGSPRALGNAIGLTFPPAHAIFAGIGFLLAAAKGVTSDYDAIMDLFGCIESYLCRLRIFSEIPLALEGILIKIMVELLDVLALATRQVKQGRFKKIAKKMLGENGVA
ncbi:hypothetical protein BC827DRAFT_1157257 [Russula dissimulans]|nr:hypothetical protein BC827DRAFT_1157257 [Russula dissimulans]